MKKRSVLICLVLCISCLMFLAPQACGAVNPYEAYAVYIPEEMPAVVRHFRGLWISTVLNLDWPSAETRDLPNEDERIQKSKEELVQILDKAIEMNMNAVIFQVSPEGDALYQSDIVPWSRYLTGTFGKDPGFDPLAFVIEEAHSRNLELHAWFNPYRVSMYTNTQTTQSLNVPKSVYIEHPEWIKTAANRYVVDPGIPEARQWVITRVMEVVDRYDVDGIHFDDYFYYEGTSSKLKDEETYNKYNNGQFSDIGDWRRNNTYLLVKELSEKIRSTKPWVKFGISPSGVWGDKSLHEDGSNTSIGYTNYDTAFADTKRWVEEELIDYIAPQVYYSFSNSRAPYGEVATWWSNVVKGKNVHLYIGQALYKINDDSDAYFKGSNALTEFSNQLKFNVAEPSISGSILFRARNLNDNAKQQVVSAMKNKLWAAKTLVPVMPWKGGKAPEPPVDASLAVVPEGIKIGWTNADPDTAYFAVYRFFYGENADETTDKSARTLIATVRNNSPGNVEWVDVEAKDPDKVQYMVTALDRLHNESEGVVIKGSRSMYYNDVGFNHAWAIEAIDYMYAKNIIMDDGQGFFYPGQNAKRGDFIQMVVRAFGLDAEVDGNFEDVAPGSYYYHEIAVAKKLGIAYGDGIYFNPDGNITREDMMVILLRALAVAGKNFELVKEDILEQYLDCDTISNYARPAVASLTKSGFIHGSNGYILPKKNATRAEIVVLLHRIIQQ